MLVDVVCLRRGGVRLPSEQVKGTQPVRGVLYLGNRRSVWHSRSRDLCAHLSIQGRAREALPLLDYCRVVKITGRGILIIGIEEKELPGRQWIEYRQAWWVRPVRDALLHQPTE
jgi:hypothetical protein